jgi:POT family proton-dependent oligopeptide transporter
MSTTTSPPGDLVSAADDGKVDKHGYRTVPDQETTAWPPGIPYIVGNEACERFSYYGMRAILFVHLSALFVLAGYLKDEAASQAQAITHLFFAGVYAFPMIGAIIADRFAGKYKTILYLSLVYCAGHAVLAIAEHSIRGMELGLALIAIGSGGIKSCVSANVGDQFGSGNWFRVRSVYQIFYFSINFGSAFATLLIPYIKGNAGPFVGRLFPSLLEHLSEDQLGTSIAFGIPGILMFIATVIFWLGRKKFIHVPPKPGGMLGMLDTLSSVALFMVFGHFFFTAHSAWYVQLGATLAALVIGLALFTARQRIQPDNGFLAITLYALKCLFTGDQAASSPDQPSPATETTSGNGPHHERRGDSEGPLAQNSFWAPAVARFGHVAAEGPVAVLKVISVFFLISVFWALFDQHATTWIRQAEGMDLSIFGTSIKPNQIQSLNPFMVMLLLPLMNLVYAGLNRVGIKTPQLGRITFGMFMTALSFVAVALIQRQIDAAGPGKIWFGWQAIAFLLLTIGEVMVSVTGLEFAYTQAPKAMKATVMGFFMLTVSLGNVLVAFLSGFEDLPLEKFFWTFAGLMGAAAVLFGIRSYFYVPKDYPQE